MLYLELRDCLDPTLDVLLPALDRDLDLDLDLEVVLDPDLLKC